ncbi:hypothetical protein BH09PSE1_BH09PSE1_05320 [soil metagenome]
MTRALRWIAHEMDATVAREPEDPFDLAREAHLLEQVIIPQWRREMPASCPETLMTLWPVEHCISPYQIFVWTQKQVWFADWARSFGNAAPPYSFDGEPRAVIGALCDLFGGAGVVTLTPRHVLRKAYSSAAIALGGSDRPASGSPVQAKPGGRRDEMLSAVMDLTQGALE